MSRELRLAALASAGVRVEDPATTHLSEEAVVEAGAVLKPFTILEGHTVVRAGAVVGPFVRLVDAEVGPGAQVLDHCLVRESVIEAGAFVGSDATLVAPVTVGAGAYVAAGSTITEDVPQDALALGRARQVTKPGWAARRRTSAPGAKARG